MESKKNRKRTWRRIVAFVVGLFVLLGVGFYIYTLDYYRASDYVDDIQEAYANRIQVKDNITMIQAKAEKDLQTGFIFYPGGKVEAKAYLPLLTQLADQGLTCFLVEMPMNLAVFNIKGAEDVKKFDTEIQRWVLGGHSLGGAMASTYAEDMAELFEALVLMGAYPVNEAEVATMSVYGTYDIMLDLEKVKQADEVFEIIDGNHAQFGDYGQQEGDGLAKISHQEQQQIAVEEIMRFILDHL